MFKIKKKAEKPKLPILYNIVEDYAEFDEPGNVAVCAMTLPEDRGAHAKVLSESYEVPLKTMAKLLTEGGVYVYPQVEGILTRGVFVCRSIRPEPFLNRLGRWISYSLPRRSNCPMREGFHSRRWRPWFFTGHCLRN